MRLAELATLLAALALVGASSPPEYDVIIRHGTVFDGSGAPGVITDVAIRGDRIMRIGDLRSVSATSEYDATGLFVTPGFVSVHDHTDFGMHARPIGLLTQGVTTAIGNPDGFGALDIHEPLRAPGGLGLNYGAYIGFNTVWQAVVGTQNRRPTPVEIARMRALVLAGLRQGAFGVSAGLDYKPGFWATTDEVVQVVSAARGWRTNFPNHDRLFEGNGYSSLAGMGETLRIGEQAGLEPVVTHMHLLSRDQGRAEDAFHVFDAARARGVTVGIDAYPYTYAATALEQILIPAWAQQGGAAAMLARFADPAESARIAAETNAIIRDRIRGPGNIYLPDLGQELTAIMAARKLSAGDAIMALLRDGQKNVILRSVTEADLDRVLRDPLTAISCDCGAITSTTGHPRNWGSYPHFFGHYVRQRKLVDWPEAISRSTALPAAMIGLAERGWLRPGMIADVTMFDPRTIIDHATVQQPTAPSTGIRAVLVNGRFAWRDGVFTPGFGQVLRRSRHEPSRPMPRDGSGGLSGRAKLANGASVLVDVRQVGSTVSGRAVVHGGPEGGFVIDRPSLLQTWHGWSALTGTGRGSDGREFAATLFVEAKDTVSGTKPSLALTLDGQSLLDSTVVKGELKPATLIAVRAR